MKTILFVCRGNRYRSRIAEEIFNSRAPKGFVAKSAGIHYQRWNDRAVPIALREIGIEMSNRKPKQATKKMLNSASRIIIFDGVKISGNAEVWPVRDSHAGDLKDIRKGRNEIEKRVKALVKSLGRSS